MKKIIIVLACLISVNTLAEFKYLKSLRPMVENFLGDELAVKIWGPKELALPEIPEVKKDAKSTDVYKNRIVEKIKFSEDKMQQYNVAYISEVIKATRKIEANGDDLGKWMGVLSQGATREGVYRALVLDQYYARLENYNEEISKKAIEFSIATMSRFANKELTKEKLQGVNIYTVKRIITERMLEVMDALLLKSREDFFDWYAVFSSELAKTGIWQNNLRQNTNPYIHKAWAKKVPYQFVKSEVIVKTHLMLNHLQMIN